MLARFERLPAADFRYRILFGGDVSAPSRADLFRGAALPGSLARCSCANRLWDAAPIDAGREPAQGELGKS
jgi:hypothetical protein